MEISAIYLQCLGGQGPLLKDVQGGEKVKSMQLLVHGTKRSHHYGGGIEGRCHVV